MHDIGYSRQIRIQQSTNKSLSHPGIFWSPSLPSLLRTRLLRTQLAEGKALKDSDEASILAKNNRLQRRGAVRGQCNNARTLWTPYDPREEKYKLEEEDALGGGGDVSRTLLISPGAQSTASPSILPCEF